MAAPTTDRPAPTLPQVLRPSPVADAIAFGPLALITVANVWRGEVGFAVTLVVLLAPFGFFMRRRLRMVLDDAGVTVTRWGTTHVPWSEVRAFEPGSWGQGGTKVVTADRIVMSSAPASRFEGRASADQIERLEAIRRARQAALTPSDAT